MTGAADAMIFLQKFALYIVPRSSSSFVGQGDSCASKSRSISTEGQFP